MRMWEIRENSDRYGKDRGKYVGYRTKTGKDAYECGYEDGYEAAMEEMEEEKPSYRRMR